MVNRRNVLKGSAAAAVLIGVPFFRPQRVFAQTAPSFDYFIAPNGDDNNAGTLASPWSITALNSKMTTYSGKNVGIIGDVGGVQTSITHGQVGGVQTTLTALANAVPSGNGPAIKINGGSSSKSTYIASCNSAGVYTPRWAVIDFGNPTVEAIAMGQSFYNSSVPNPGYTTVDALVIQNFNYAALGFSNLTSNTMLGIVIQNCQISHGRTGSSADNPGAILLAGSIGAVIHNNRIFDLQTQGGVSNPWGFNALRTYGNTTGGALGLVVTNNTFYNCNSILTKDYSNDFANCSYNYFDHGNFGSAANVDPDVGAACIVGHAPGAGVTSVIHHNIFLGPFQAATQEGTNSIQGTCKLYNNTFYGTANYPGFLTAYCKNAQSSAAAIQFYNNVCYASATYDHSNYGGGLWVSTPFTVANATFNNNVYGSNSNGQAFSRTSEDQGLTLAQWQAATGCDANSVLVSNPFSGTPAALTPSAFAVNSSAVIGGVTCGALDGSGLVGCNFDAGPVPNAAVLSVS